MAIQIMSICIASTSDYIKEFYDTGVQYSNTVTASAGSDKLTGRLIIFRTAETMVLFLTTLSIDNTST